MYQVKFENQVDEVDNNVDGMILYGKQVIRIKKNMSIDYAKEVLLHEIIHGVFQFCGLENDENTVNRLSQALYQVLKDNDLKF